VVLVLKSLDDLDHLFLGSSRMVDAKESQRKASVDTWHIATASGSGEAILEGLLLRPL
jgi:hypothetical protein